MVNSPHQRLRHLRRHSIYLLPNAFTSAGLFGGFYAIVQAMNGQFANAAVAIFISMILDALDGRVARLTHSQSAFGAEYDSLSDMVSFGVAPALVIYQWALQPFHKIGWMAAFLYTICAALRLARFNTTIAVVDKRFFQGLPSPAAAALVAGLVWLMQDNGFSPDAYPLLRWAAFFTTVAAAITMVSPLAFYSFKAFKVRTSVPFFGLLLLVLLLLVVAYDAPIALFSLFVLYALSGYAYSAWKWLKRPQHTLPKSRTPSLKR